MNNIIKTQPPKIKSSKIMGAESTVSSKQTKNKLGNHISVKTKVGMVSSSFDKQKTVPKTSKVGGAQNKKHLAQVQQSFGNL